MSNHFDNILNGLTFCLLLLQHTGQNTNCANDVTGLRVATGMAVSQLVAKKKEINAYSPISLKTKFWI